MIGSLTIKVSGSVVDYSTEGGKRIPVDITIETNAYWVYVYKGNKLVFKREASGGPWLDTDHNTLVNLIEFVGKTMKD